MISLKTQDQTGVDGAFASDPGHGVETHEFINNRIGDLVADFVGVTLGHGFRTGYQRLSISSLFPELCSLGWAIIFLTSMLA